MMKLLITQFSKKEARLIINKLCRLYLFAKEVSRRILLFLIKVTKKDEKLLFYENGVYNKLYFYTSLQSSRSMAFITNTINIKNSGLQCTPQWKNRLLSNQWSKRSATQNQVWTRLLLPQIQIIPFLKEVIFLMTDLDFFHKL